MHPGFLDSWLMLLRHERAEIKSSRGTIYAVTANHANGLPYILAESQTTKNTKLRVFRDDWNQPNSKSGTRLGGLFNGPYSIFDWYTQLAEGSPLGLSLTEQRRLNSIRTKILDKEELEENFGISPSNRKFLSSLKAYSDVFRNDFEGLPNGYNRQLIESWFQFHKILPVGEAALRLGMTATSMKRVQRRLIEKKLFFGNAAAETYGFVEEDLTKGLRKILPSTRSTIFESHSHFCEVVHQAIKTDLNIEIEAVYCTSSCIKNPSNPDYAYYKCIISGQPTSLKNAIPLSTGKSVRLAPDNISDLTLLRGYDMLSNLALTTPPDKESLLSRFSNAH